MTAVLIAATATTVPVFATADAEAAELLIYSSRHYGQEAAFEAFTKRTGIQLKILNGSAGELFERLKAEGERSPADILLTVDAGNLWNAARAGLLSRIDSPQPEANIPAHLRDPDARWVGLTVRARTIMYNTKKVTPAELSTYEALGDPKWKGRLCLRPSSYIYTQSLIATMIKRHGEAKTEEIVRRWAPNQQTTGMHVNISGAGVTAPAKNRAEAIKFLEFLSSPEAQQMFADLSFEYPANPQAAVNPVVARWGKFKQDDINVAAAGEFQAAAVRLADRAGYK
jgi:iron(III) transport system substrate-binding protein